MTATRRLAAILAADVAGYARLIGANEAGTLVRLRAIRAEVIDPAIATHNGRLVKTTGDGLLVEFSSVVDALCSATEIQAGMAERNAPLPQHERIEFRMGLNVGDVVVEDGDIFGDGVNVAARLEGLAEPGGICVSARVQEDAVGKVDLVFDDMGEQQLKNIARPVRVYRVRDHAALNDDPTPVLAQSLPLPDKPSIAVLPFANLSGDPEQEYFADGMVEEIITALSRIRWLFVIARNSSFTYRGKALDVKQVGRELGVRYVLEGSVRKAGGRVRITAQLIDALSGAHLWADRFDGSLEDVFELQDKVASSVAGAIEPSLEAAEIFRSANRATNNLGAQDLYLRALPHAFSWERVRIILALDLLERAIELDPRYGAALGLAGFCHNQLDISGLVHDQHANRQKGIALARRALQAAGDDPAVLGAGAFVLAYFGGDINTTCGLMDRALALNPSFARGWAMSGWMRLYAGQPVLAIEHFERSLRLNPRDRRPYPVIGIGFAHFFNRRFDDAVAALRTLVEELPNFPTPYRFLASSYAHMGRLDDAREIIEQLRVITSVVVLDFVNFWDPKHRELLLSGLRLAAGEAT
jgi:TolB-like protein/class 3 adenylate cyclase